MQTTHLLKKCVLVPKNQLQRADTAFKRGVMDFEDFNYDLFNPYILVREEESQSEDSDV